MFWGIVEEYNWSFDQGSNDLNAISPYGWKGEAHRKFANINAMTFPKIRHVVLTKLQLWPVRRPSKINGPFHWLLEISYHTFTENVAMCFQKYKGDSLLTTNVSCKCCTIMGGLRLIVEQNTLMWTVDRNWANYKNSSHSTWKPRIKNQCQWGKSC